MKECMFTIKMKFKKRNVSYITSNDLILLGHFVFSIVNLNTNEMLYEDPIPFGVKNRQIAKILYNESNGAIFVLSFNGDFAIYKINKENNQVTKQHFYKQKGNWYQNDCTAYWLDENYLYTFIEKGYSAKSTLRRISYNGDVKDNNFDVFITPHPIGEIENQQIIRFGKKRKAIIDGSSDTLDITDLTSIESAYKKKNIVGIFTDGNLNNVFFLTKNKDVLYLYKKESELIKVDSYKIHSKTPMLYAKVIDNSLAIVEMDTNLDLDSENLISHSAKCMLHFKHKNVEKTFDLSNLYYKNPSMHLSSFNNHWIAFWDKHIETIKI